MKKYTTLVLNIIALGAALFIVANDFVYEGWSTIVWIVVVTGIGYWFGSLTCHLHERRTGFWITVGVFSLFNFLHSMIDGASVSSASLFANTAIITHEIARQPALYLVLYGMLTPFITHRVARVVAVPIIVTGVWVLGVISGNDIVAITHEHAWYEHLAHLSIYLFVGDIIHHIHEEYRKLYRKTECCHH